MKLVSAEYTFDETKILFYFTSEGRVDFRELVKDLALEFKTRIELRQIGVRDESKVMGSVGVCGRGLCCSSWLEEFVPVSIKMAKEQGLSLNPSKISGACGRLMCCLKYEQEAYEDLIKNTPGAGVKVRTPDGDGVVESVSLLQGKVRVIIEKNDEKTINEYFVDQVERIGANNENLPEEEIN
jgi:cell fate regulator YaaT (PSP1 superfamily)